MENNLPEMKFSTGGVQVTIWRNSGEKGEFRTVSFDKRYKDKEGNWKSTNTLMVNDLPKAIVALNKAYEYSVLRNTAE